MLWCFPGISKKPDLFLFREKKTIVHDKTIIPAAQVIKRTTGIKTGPRDSKNCPMNHGKNIPAVPPPMRNQLVTRLVIPMLRSAKLIEAAKRGPIDTPMITVPAHVACADPVPERTMIPAATHPVMFIISIDPGFKRIEIGTDSSLPNVRAPQNAEVR